MQQLIRKSLLRRYRKENSFKFFSLLSIGLSLLFLIIFFTSIIYKGHKAFFTHRIAVEINLSKESIIKNSELEKQYSELTKLETIEQTSYQNLIREALRNKFPDFKTASELNFIYTIVSDSSDYYIRNEILKNHDLLGSKHLFWLDVSSKVDIFFKYKNDSFFSENEKITLEKLFENNEIKRTFNLHFFLNADSREPEVAGIAAATTGSFLAIIIFLILSFPIGVACAFYLEEFAPKGYLTDLIEISINNLAAIPSIIYGLLGLTIYLQTMHLPRSSALVGGMTLFMLALPVIIIATRNTIRSIPQSIRDGAMALGASKTQIMLHHLLPLSIPGIMTGTILAMSRALGETAPLLMIGMVAFIADIPKSFLDPATALPVQIYLWSDSPEIGFVEKTAAAIIILLTFLIMFNLIAIILRKKFEKKW